MTAWDYERHEYWNVCTGIWYEERMSQTSQMVLSIYYIVKFKVIIWIVAEVWIYKCEFGFVRLQWDLLSLSDPLGL